MTVLLPNAPAKPLDNLTEIYKWPRAGHWTYIEYVRFTEVMGNRFRYEIIEGHLQMMAAPTPQHQEIVANINEYLRRFVKQHKLGKVYFSPIDVVLDKLQKSTVQPDLLFIPINNLAIVERAKIFGVPDLIVEVLSSNRADDLETKFKLYAQYGVQEYWIVDPVNETVEVFVLQDELFVIFGRFTHSQIVHSNQLNGIHIPVDEIFDL